MGLTIHYRLQSSVQTDGEIYELIERLRQKALDMPFKEVGEIVDLAGDGCSHSNFDAHDPLSWMLIQAEHILMGKQGTYSVPPTRLIAFSVWPGEGCEQANFGLCQYPEQFTTAKGVEKETGITGWFWESFCKTQYASNPAAGGIEHFLRCHLSLIALLATARGCAGHLGVCLGNPYAGAGIEPLVG